jgi:G3E family GTPase
VLVEPRLRHAFALGNIICCLDSMLGPEQLARQPIARQQVVTADRLILTKTEMVSNTRLTALQAQTGALNPAAHLIESTLATPAPAALLMEGSFSEEGRADEIRRWASLAGQKAGFSLTGQRPVEDDAAATIEAIVLAVHAPLPWERFVLWLTMLLHAHGAQILRTKAILQIEGAATPVALHAVQHIVHPPLHLPAMPPGLEGSQIVMIAQGIGSERLRASFRAFVQSCANNV